MDLGQGTRLVWNSVKSTLSSVEPQGGGDGGHNLADQLGQVGVRRSLDVQVFPADVVDGLVVHHEGAVGVLEGGVVVRIELYGSTTAVDTQRVASGHQSLLVKNLIETSVRINRRVRRRSRTCS